MAYNLNAATNAGLVEIKIEYRGGCRPPFVGRDHRISHAGGWPMIDLREARARLLPPSGWRLWQKPRPSLEIDEWVSGQTIQRRNASDRDHEGCPYWYVRRGIVTGAELAAQQASKWTEKQNHIADALTRYGDDAAAIVEVVEALSQRLSSFWQLHLGIDGNMFRYDHYKVADVPPKPDISRVEMMLCLQQIADLPEILKLKAVTENARAARRAWLNNQGDIWKNTFVSHLGLVWSDIVGSPPTNSDPFQAFLSDAWMSLDGPDDASFDRAIVNVTRGFRRKS